MTGASRWQVLALVTLVAAVAHARVERPKPPPTLPAPRPPGGDVYPGFGSRTTGGAGRRVFLVTTLADSGPGSLRQSLVDAGRAGGGTIRFSVGGNIDLQSGLAVPEHTTIDGASAPDPRITLWGERAGIKGTGVVNIFESDVIVRGLRVRNGLNDGFHIVPRNGHAISNIVVDHCSITNNGDGGIDITGYKKLPVMDLTIIGNYLAGNGGPCGKGTCGGGSLVKYGATRVSYYYNFWDKNLRRTPAVSADKNPDFKVIADIRYNVIRAPEQSGIQIREGALANVVGNDLRGPRAEVTVELWGGRAYVKDNPSDLEPRRMIAQPIAVPGVPRAKTADDVMSGAGVVPRDAVDRFYVDTATTFAQVKAKTFDH